MRPLSKLLLQGADDDSLHSLVRLGDQVHGRALGLDLNLALSGNPDFLNESRSQQNVDADPLPAVKPDFTHLSGFSCHFDRVVVGFLPRICHFLHRLGANWENAARGTDFQNERSRKVSTPPPFRRALPSSYKRTGCATTPRLPVAAALLHIAERRAAKGNSWDGCGARLHTASCISQISPLKRNCFHGGNHPLSR